LGEILKYQPGDQIKKVMDVACSTYGGEEAYRAFWWGNMTEREQLPELGIDGTITKRVLKEMGWVGAEWNDLAQYTWERGVWRGLVGKHDGKRTLARTKKRWGNKTGVKRNRLSGREVE
jgi:hypothetical protein